MARRLASEEGLLAGTSTELNVTGAIEIASAGGLTQAQDAQSSRSLAMRGEIPCGLSLHLIGLKWRA